MSGALKRYFFTVEQTEGTTKSNFVVDFKAETLELAKQEYEEVLGWCGGYKILQIVERNTNEPVGNDFVVGLFVSSGDI